MNDKKIRIKPYIIAGIVSLAIAFLIIGIFWIVRKINLSSTIDGCMYSAVALICAGGLIYVTRCGFFDLMTYGFKQMGSQLFSKKPSEYNNLASYKDEKNQVRTRRSKYYFVLLGVGVLFLIAAIILNAILTH